MRTLLLILSLLTLVALSAPSRALVLGPGEPLTQQALEDLVDEGLAAVADAALDGRLRVEIHEPRLPLANQSESSTEIRLEGLEHHPRSGRFTATLSGVTVDSGRRFAMSVRGRAVEMVEVPVVNRRLERGERLGPADLDWLDVPADRLPAGAILEPEQVLGSEAKRRLRADRILTARDIGQPLLVRRNQPVRLVYRLAGLTISTLGTAQDDGAAGNPVRVVTHDSRRQIQGLVTGPDEVTVSSAPAITQ